jgi:hypothetical protein
MTKLDLDFITREKERFKGRTAFVTSPVRNSTEAEKGFLKEYKGILESPAFGYALVHVPLFDTPQSEEDFEDLGYVIDKNFKLSTKITKINCEKMIGLDENHYLNSPNSSGSIHDLGVFDALVALDEMFEREGLKRTLNDKGFRLDKRFFLINPQKPDSSKSKSFPHLLLEKAEQHPVEGEDVLRSFADLLLARYGI